MNLPVMQLCLLWTVLLESCDTGRQARLILHSLSEPLKKTQQQDMNKET